jgi:outer membrane lipoprotein
MLTRRYPGLLLCGLLLLAISGCAYPIAAEWRHRANRNLTFSEVAHNPEAYTGNIVIWGGLIMETSNPPDGGEITVLQSPLDYDEFPEIRTTYGQFIAKAPTFLDPVIYKKGRKVTLAGEIIGQRVKTFEVMLYTYPLVRVKEIYLWSREKHWWEPPSFYGWKWDFQQPYLGPYPQNPGYWDDLR